MAHTKVEGIVESHLGTKGFRLAERINTSTGQTFTKPWTIWATQPAIGAFVEVSGELRAEVAKHYETKEIMLTQAGLPYVALTISDALVTVLRDAVPAEATQWEQPAAPATNGPVPF
jgi:hypothetical protein